MDDCHAQLDSVVEAEINGLILEEELHASRTLPLVKQEQAQVYLGGQLDLFDPTSCLTELGAADDNLIGAQIQDTSTVNELSSSTIKMVEMPGTDPHVDWEWQKYRNHDENSSTYPLNNRYGQKLTSLQNYVPRDGSYTCKMCDHVIPKSERNKDFKGSCRNCVRKEHIWLHPTGFVFKHCQGCRKELMIVYRLTYIIFLYSC